MKLCAECGLPEDAHHDFVPTMPIGCKCVPGTWGDKIWPICEKYQGDGNGYCQSCEHDKACHHVIVRAKEVKGILKP